LLALRIFVLFLVAAAAAYRAAPASHALACKEDAEAASGERYG